MRLHQTTGYPPLFFERRRRLGRSLFCWGIVLGWIAGDSVWGYFHDWKGDFFALAPLFSAVFLLFLFWVRSIWRDFQDVRIVPYFQKGEQRIKATTYNSGRAVARQFQLLEQLARKHSLEPLSSFGFEDDLNGETVIWHSAASGLRTVQGLLNCCKPEVEQARIKEDLCELETALQSALMKDVLFCLLLRHGTSFSGAEMDARQGYLS